MSNDQSGGGHNIILKVKNHDGSDEVFLRIKRSTQLKKLMYVYCDLQSVDYQSLTFMFKGRRLLGEQTPHDLAMEEGDEISALLVLKGC